MVAVIHSGKSLREAVNYNENKVKKQAAVFLQGGYYLKDPDKLTFQDKLSRLQKLIDLNDRVKVNTLHISLNFAAEDKLSQQKLKEISALYLNKIGFENQPYLLYEHKDVAHQHVHIVTTNIKPDGSSINLHNIGKIRSEAARKQIEIEFKLVKAEEHKRQVFELKPVQVSKVSYGKSETKQAISNILSSVVRGYKYTSIPELNAVLTQYNILADRGAEGSRIFKNQGLTYRILDESGNRVGVPIKASDFHFKPTLKFLQQRFEENQNEREKFKSKLKNSVDLILQNRGVTSLISFTEHLERAGVVAVLRRSDTGLLYGITYVDHRTKCVFNGSALGKQFTAKAVQEICAEKIPNENVNRGKPIGVKSELLSADRSNGKFRPDMPTTNFKPQTPDDNSMLDDLFRAENNGEPIPWQLRKSRKSKKKKGLGR